MQAIFNGPPSIAEDAIHYALYPQESSSDKTSVTCLALVVQKFVEPLLTDFLWHRDTFQIKVVQDTDGSGWFLEGRMRVGDSIDDEWCVVWLLREASKKWDFAISIRDSDGEFLLIEAADYLPLWVTPSVVENRVWIYKSHLHLIPLSHVSSPSGRGQRIDISAIDDKDIITSEDFLNISDALRLVHDPLTDTQAPASVEQAVWQRISKYPSSLLHHVHKAKAYLPVDISKALSVHPALVQRAAEIFYTRDAIQLRAAHKMTRFPPQPYVLQTVRLTRTAYAQLVGQKFYPPKIFGRWQEEATPQWRWRDLGMKIACGFEMLYQEGGTREVRSNTSPADPQTVMQARKDALQRDPEYAKYIKSIQGAGYFRGEIEGSQLWNEMESRALEVFLQSRREQDTSRPSFASQVNAAIAKANDPKPSEDVEDPDDWLTINAEDFDSVLQEKMRRNETSSTSHAMDLDHSSHSETEEDAIATSRVAKLRDLANKVDAFVAGKGDVEGAMFEDEQISEEDEDDSSDARFSDSEIDSDDHEESASAARRDALEKLVPGIEPSEYGRMPASFYDRSQRVAPEKPTNEVAVEENAESTREIGTSSAQFRAPILARDHYEGVDSDDDSEEDGPVDEEDEEEQPQLVGEIEVDMAEEEEEFLEFSRQTLGISDDQWEQILQDRRKRGAFVPSYVKEENHPRREDSIRKLGTSDARGSQSRNPEGVSQKPNPNLDSFEAVMRAMDEELVRMRSQKASANFQDASLGDNGKGKARAQDAEEGVDIETAMDAELKAALDDDDEDEVELGPEGNVDYNLIKNFLESFKSQGGLSGPVSNLAGRLEPGGWGLPRDDS
ncbi:SGT1 protein-domain-containing protein [Russula dissimulans]|nr:SGT1 protein-domain-containing protein [Russula dissimulans]